MNPALSDAEKSLRLAQHHLVDDHDPFCREWAVRHMKEAIIKLQSANLLGNAEPIKSLIPLTEDEASKPLTEDQVWVVHEFLDTTIRRQKSKIDSFIEKRVPRFNRDIGVVLIVLLVMFGLYRKYNGLPLNLWSNKYETMDLTINNVTQGYGQLQLNKTVDRIPVMVNSKYYPTAIGTHAESRIDATLNKSGKFLRGGCAYPDSVRGGEIICVIEANGRELFRSAKLNESSRLSSFAAQIENVSNVTLRVLPSANGINAAHAVWIELRVTNE